VIMVRWIPWRLGQLAYLFATCCSFPVFLVFKVHGGYVFHESLVPTGGRCIGDHGGLLNRSVGALESKEVAGPRFLGSQGCKDD
jgi:hypothetical protein